jgi:type VI secretion system secreted protein Hcp
MPHEAYIQFEGIDARIDQSEETGRARLLSFRHNVTQPGAGSAAMSGESGPGRAEHGDFIILKDADEASPRLALACCSGFRIPTVTVTVHDAADSRLRFLEYRMSDVVVRAVRPFLPEAGDQSTGGGARVVREEVALRYRRIAWTYTLVSAGATQGSVRTYWDLQGNTGG